MSATTVTIGTTCKKRLINDYRLLQKEPCEYIDAIPDEKDMLVWYFLIKGPPDTDYVGGWYLGKIMHNPDYPAKPPNYMMLTPNGRFNINGNICMTNTGYHVSDWSPLWNIVTMLMGFLSVMTSDKDTGVNHIKSSKKDRKTYADASIEYNKKHYFNIFTRFKRFIDKDGNPIITETSKPITVNPDKSEPTVVIKKEEPVKEEEVYVDPEVAQFLDAVQLRTLKEQLREENRKKKEQELKLINDLRLAKEMEERELQMQIAQAIKNEKKLVAELNEPPVTPPTIDQPVEVKKKATRRVVKKTNLDTGEVVTKPKRVVKKVEPKLDADGNVIKPKRGRPRKVAANPEDKV